MNHPQSLQRFIAFTEDSILDVLRKISENKSRIIFVVSEHAVLEGSVSDGDIRRWLTGERDIDLSLPISSVMNRAVRSLTVDSSKDDIRRLFSDGVEAVPLVDSLGRLIKIEFQKADGIFIEGREISEKSPAFIIAEIGNNHQGDVALAKQLVDHAIAAKVDCVKFQMRDVSSLYINSSIASADLGVQYTMDLLAKFELTNEQLFEVFDYCKLKKVLPLCTPWDLASLKQLETYGMPAYKVASADFTNYELLEAVARTKKPMICSTGMATEHEIKATVSFLDQYSADFVLLHCNSTYPTPFKDVNLKYMTRLRKITGKMVGYSGHERGIEVPVAAIALDACVIEKHITIDKELEGTDHKVSLLPEEFSELVIRIRNVEESLGIHDKPREITQGEMLNRENLAKSLVAKVDINMGSVITREMIIVKSPGQGVQPNRVNDLVGKVAKRDIRAAHFFYDSDIDGRIQKRSDYRFVRPVGVPVRYHDYKTIISDTNMDFVEFHLSYKDLEVDLTECFEEDEGIGFAVHCPELFEKDHILDLAATDEKYRAQSIRHLSRVVDITRSLKQFFPNTENPVIVVNAGGWDYDGFVDTARKPEMYQRVSEAFELLDLADVQIAIQTMPPFPWHFGGQSFHNLFVAAEEIVKFCSRKAGIGVCLDVSHTMMACNYYGWNLNEFVTAIAPYIVHLHIVDALGVDGEGVVIGDGDVDFDSLTAILRRLNPQVQFIPEVWQGHKNQGEGFWGALNFLEKCGL